MKPESPQVEASIEQALVRICNADSVTLGTGFVVAREGLILTCHHVIDGMTGLRVWLHDRMLEATAEESEELAKLDLALLRCDSPCEHVLPLEMGGGGLAHAWSKGFHYQHRGLSASVPVSLEIIGRSNISYTTSRYRYELERVLVLEGSAFDRGISGAPLVEPMTGVVLGVINTHQPAPGTLRGCALPFDVATQHSPVIAKLMARNREEVPRPGRFVNAVQAQALCDRQARLALQRLITQKLYLPDKYCERAEGRNVLLRFLQSDKRILSLVGESGVGKTTLLARMVSDRGVRPMLLLRGYDISPDAGDLPTLVAHALQKVDPQRTEPAALVKALNEGGTPLTVALDGLNEARLGVEELSRDWIPEAQEWLHTSHAQLVVSCRPEYWSLVREAFHKENLYSDNNGQGLLLGDFSEAEVQTARESYALPATLTAEDVRHPLMFRIWWETQEEAAGPVLNRAAVFERFVLYKCRKIAKTLGGTPPESFIRGLLSKLARVTLEERTYGLDQERYISLFAGHDRIGFELVREHVFYETAEGYRFTFDELAEFLQSEHIDLRRDLRESRLLEPQGGNQFIWRGAVTFKFLRLELTEQTGELEEALLKLLALHEAHPSIELVGLFVSVCSRLGNPRRYYPLARQWVDSVVRTWDAPESPHGPELRGIAKREAVREFLSLLDGGRFTPEQTLTLLRPLLPGVNFYPWRQKDRPLQSRYFAEGGGLVNALAGAISVDPRRSFEVLVSWLTDRTHLRGGEASVAAVAQACLFQFRHHDFDYLCELLARAPLEGGRGLLLQEFCASDPLQLVEACARWAASGEPAREELAGNCLLQVPTQEPKVRRHAKQVMEELYDHARAVEMRTLGAVGLVRFEDTRERVLEYLKQAFSRGDPRVSAYDFQPTLPTHLPEILQLFKNHHRWLDHPSEANLRSFGCLRALSFYNQELEHQRAITGWYRELLGHSPQLDNQVAIVVDEKLNLLTPELARNSELLALAEHILYTCGPAARRNLLYFAYSSVSQKAPFRELVEPLRSIILNTERELDNLALLTDLVAYPQIDEASAFAALDSISRVVAPLERGEYWLVEQTQLNSDVGPRLWKWLEQQTVFIPCREALVFLVQCRAGKEPSRAAMDALG